MSMVASAPMAERPGSSFFAPGVRIRKLDALQAGPQPGEDIPADMAADIQSVEVTRVHNGGSQYSITLNNWYTSTAADRRVAREIGERELRGRETPEWPRWKYNHFDLVTFGQRLRIDLRYWPEQATAGDPGGWVPMVAGPVTDMRFNLGQDAATVVVTGEDDLSALNDRRKGRHEFEPSSERDLVTSLLTLAQYPLGAPAAPLIDWPEFATQADGPAEAIDDGQSYFEFLQKIADRLDLEVFIEFADLGDADAGVELHVEPARSPHPPSAQPDGVYVIERGKNLLSYTPTISVVDQYSEVRVRGRDRDRETTDPIDKTASAADVQGELHDVGASTGPDVRAHFFPDRDNPQVLANQTNLDPARGQFLAQVTLRRRARELFTIEARTIGLPRLRPGAHIEVRGLRPPFDGFFYVTRTVHSFGADGYTTTFSGRRPGMPLPPYEGS
jgi:uncharacterized protein